MKNITYRTPIGFVEVDPTPIIVHHTDSDGNLVMNQVIYKTVLHGYYGDEPQDYNGYSHALSIPESLMHKVVKPDNILIGQGKYWRVLDGALLIDN